MKSSSKKLLVVFNIKIVILFLFCSINAYSQTTRVTGIVRDSVSNLPLEFAAISFEGTNIGKLTDDDGKFTISNTQGKGSLVVSLMGYDSKKIQIPIGKVSDIAVKLKPSGVQLGEVVVTRTKEKYVKKDNPAVALIKKVIEHKHDYLITSQDYYMNDEYDRILFAVNEYDESKGIFKRLKFFSKYADTSLIDHKKILPFSVRETLSNVYYRKNPQATRRVITAYQNEGLDKQINTESIDGIIAEVFNEIDITDNTINLLLHDFVSPLSSTSSVDFYKWYIIDTVQIDQKKYVNLGFVPFNTRDVGFIGNIYVQPDAPYAIKQISFRVPSKINVNYIENMIVTQEFEEKNPELWVPTKFTMAIDFSMYNIGKFYVQKERVFNNFLFDLPIDAAFSGSAPVLYLSDYNKHQSDFWSQNRPDALNKDYQMDEMINEFRKNKFIDISLKVADVLSSQYVATNKEEEKNKLDLGTPLTFYSYNHLEGNRIRLTAATTKYFNPHLFLYGYGAYGTKDHKWKYYGEVTWAFNRKNYHKDEFPRNNLSIAYKYDVNPLGQRFLQAERDNILLSFRAKKYNNMTYARMAEVNYLKEFYNGFSYNLYGKTNDQEPAGDLRFERWGEENNLIEMGNLKTTEIGLNLRYAHNEKFFQQRRRRRSLPSKGIIISYSHSLGLKDVFDGQYSYNKSSLSLDKELWIAPYGRLGMTLKGEKIWGSVPYPLLLSGNANSSLTIQRGSFYMLRPMEFLSDSQLIWDVNYRMGGWLFNRIPLINRLKWREIAGFRGIWGNLSDRNNPTYNHDLMVFPEDVGKLDKQPYMEYSLGIENIFQFFRIDYVRRINYLRDPGIEKHGFRISFDVSF